MTLKEKVICECYTGIVFTSGEERNELYHYLADLFGRPVYTNEIPNMIEEIKSRSKRDFINVLRGLYGNVTKNKSSWTSCHTPPDETMVQKYDKFLVVGRKGGRQIGKYLLTERTWVDAAGHEIRPTHWMELPESPGKGTHETENS